MQDRYSSFSPVPRLPSDMLRSVLLSVKFKITSYTKWASDLKENHLHAILSGFQVGAHLQVSVPFMTSFPDCGSQTKTISPSPFIHLRKKPQKSKGNEQKAPPVEKVTVKDLFLQFEEHAPHDMDPCMRIYEIFRTIFLNHSVDDGLISLKSLALAGDGTPVYTSAQERKQRTCNCLENGNRDCNCDRFYSQPDCNIGWDSHRNRFYFGYDLYMLTASDSVNSLPVFSSTWTGIQT